MVIDKKLKSLYFKIFESPELFTNNIIETYLQRKDLNRYIDKNFKLSNKQIKEIKEYWKPYKNISPKWALYYSARNGNFDPRYIPCDLYFTAIDQHFNSRKLGYGFNDKNYYSKIFADVLQPKILVRKINGIILDNDYKLITEKKAIEIIKEYEELICKPTQETGSGRSVVFFKSDDDKFIKDFLSNDAYDDFVIQDIIKQHPLLEKIHNGSINSIRICTLLMPESVYVLSSCLRIGIGKSRIDNVTAGGISCGIKENGFLNKYSYTSYIGEKLSEHPNSKIVYEQFEVPGYFNAINLVKNLHSIIPHFRLVFWDIAINAKGNPMLIECNMRKGGIKGIQLNNGPLFVCKDIDLTKRVLNEVFKK